jgi:asparagine synthase (glutamine-hydrolysing)
MEKFWLRDAFSEDNLLPDEVLWRRKEAFSDGISSKEKSWYQIVQDHIQRVHQVDERTYYRTKFVEFFGERRLSIIPGYWQPFWDASGAVIKDYVDPSARTLDIYNKPLS